MERDAAQTERSFKVSLLAIVLADFKGADDTIFLDGFAAADVEVRTGSGGTVLILGDRGQIVLRSLTQLDKDDLRTFESADESRGAAARLKLSPGDTVELPDGAGSITFERVDRWVKLQVSDTPGKGLALFGVLLGILGLMGSLFVRPRRVWVRASPDPEDARRTVVALAGLDRSSGGDLAGEIDELERKLRPKEDR